MFCLGVTPLYDAASNGHLKIVELLLDRGASAITKTDEGDTPLNILKEWHRVNHLTGEDLTLCQSLISRMSEIMQRAGQKVLSVNSSSQPQKDFKHRSNVRSQEINRTQLKKKSPRTDRSMLLDLEENNVTSGNVVCTTLYL